MLTYFAAYDVSKRRSEASNEDIHIISDAVIICVLCNTLLCYFVFMQLFLFVHYNYFSITNRFLHVSYILP